MFYIIVKDKTPVLLTTRNRNNESKQRKVAVEYVRLCGYKNGEIGKNHTQQCQNGTPEKLTLDEIASQLGTSKRDLQRALSIEHNLTDSMKELFYSDQIFSSSSNPSPVFRTFSIV